MKKKYRRLETNYFNQCADTTELLETWIEERAIGFAHDDVGINRVYFYSCSDLELVEVLKQFPVGSCIDYITKDLKVGMRIFEKAGFHKHLEYGRFVYVGLNEVESEREDELKEVDADLHSSKYGEPAKVEDAEIIDSQLREHFDKYEAHFYSLETLKAYIEKGWVWIARENGKIIAANMFEIQGKKCYGAYLYNNGDVEVLTSLIYNSNCAIAKLGVSYFYCWMNLGNKRSIRYNTNNGYRADGLYDLIYVKGD